MAVGGWAGKSERAAGGWIGRVQIYYTEKKEEKKAFLNANFID